MKLIRTVKRFDRLLMVVCLALACAAFAVPAQARNLWNERTVLRFDKPVMIPGATLQPGTYVFKLANSKADRNIMQVFKADPQNPAHIDRMVATTLTVPTKRENANGDVVLKFAETSDNGAPVALKAFFYPGTLYGHEFVYSDSEAQQIAQNTHKLVLSRDMQGSDMQSGTLHNIDGNGNRTAWQEDPSVAREWAAWIVSWNPTMPGESQNGGSQNGAVGTSGHSSGNAWTGNSNGTNSSNRSANADRRSTSSSSADRDARADRGARTSQDHAQAIERLVNDALRSNGSTVTIDRSTLERIRSHAEAIEQGNGGGTTR